VHALSGLDLAVGARTDAGRPLPSGVFTADVLAGALAFGAINAALVGVAHSGEGAHLDVSLTDSVLSMLVHEAQAAQVPEGLPSAAYEAVRTNDGYVMVAVLTDRHFAALCRAIDAPHLLSDSRFATMAERRFNTRLMCAEVEDWSQSRSAADVERLLNEAGVPCGQYRTAGSWLDDDDMRLRGVVRQASDRTGTYAVVSGAPGHLDDDGRPTPRIDGIDAVSDLGEHSRAILRDLGGLDDDHISALVDAGVVVD
jgi:crotonobetainyl-CoA:carnitine CoA-transferase CaiB-like acyl-CoA transferase